MKKVLRWLSAAVLIAGIAALFAAGSSNTAKAEGEHVHCVCGGYFAAGSASCPYKDAENGDSGKIHADGVTWTAWTSTSALPTAAGYYYLTADVTMTTQGSAVSETAIYVCLNGHDVKQTRKGSVGAFRVLTYNGKTNAKYVFTDCSDTPGTILHSDDNDKANGQGAMFWMNSTGNTLEAYRITLDTTYFWGSYGPILIQNNSSNAMKFYGVTIEGGKTTGNGGTMQISSGVVEMYETTVKAGTSGAKGNCIYFNGGTLRIYDKCVVEDVYLGPNKSISAGKLSDGTYIGVQSEEDNVKAVYENSNIAQNVKYIKATNPAQYLYNNGDNSLWLKPLSDETDAHVTTGHCVCADTSSATSENGHASHDDGQKWVPWNTPETLPRGFEGQTSYFYLTTDMTLSVQATVAKDARVYLCLNGHSISFSQNGRMLSTNAAGDSEYVFTNCGTVNTGTGAGWIRSTSSGSYSAQGGIIWMSAADTAKVTLYNVGLDGGDHKIGMYGGLVGISKGVFRAYDVQFINGNVYDSDPSKGYGNGGAIGGQAGSEIYLYGCDVSECSAERNGGSIYSTGARVLLSNVFMDGGSAKLGGNVYTGSTVELTVADSIIMSGSTPELTNDGNYAGGNLYTLGTTELKDSSAIFDGSAGRGGNVMAAGGTFTMNDGIIIGGYSPSGGNVRVNEATFRMVDGFIGDVGTLNGTPANNSVFLNLKAVMTMEGGKIRTETAPDREVFFVNGSVKASTSTDANASFTMTGGTIAAAAAGDPAISNRGGLTISDGYVWGTINSYDSATEPNQASSASISGGKYNFAFPEALLSDGYYQFDYSETLDGLDYTLEVARGYLVQTTAVFSDGSPAAVGSASGGGVVKTGGEAVLTATVPAGANALNYEFAGWYNEALTTLLGSGYSYTASNITGDTTFAAVYSQKAAVNYTVTVNADAFTYAVGSGAAAAGASPISVPAGSVLTLTYTGTKVLDSWLNGSGKIVSRDASYTFTVNGNTTLTAGTAEESAKQVMFYTMYYQLISSKALDAVTDSDLASVPEVIGKTNGQWTVNGNAVATKAALVAAAGDAASITVVAKYEDDGTTYTVTVIGKEEGNDPAGIASWTSHAAGDGSFTANLGLVALISAAQDGFLYFAAADGTPVSYANETNVRYAANTTLYAVYGTSVQAEPVVTMISADKTGTTVSFEALRSLPEGYTVTEQGILFALESTLTGAAEEALVYNFDPSTVYKYQSNGTALNDVTGLTIKRVPGTVAARAFVIYSDGTNQGIIYSDVAVK